MKKLPLPHSEIFLFNGIAIVATPLPNFAFGLTDVVITTSVACHSIYDIPSITCEVVA